MGKKVTSDSSLGFGDSLQILPGTHGIKIPPFFHHFSIKKGLFAEDEDVWVFFPVPPTVGKSKFKVEEIMDLPSLKLTART